jgi:hypothetical protein
MKLTFPFWKCNRSQIQKLCKTLAKEMQCNAVQQTCWYKTTVNYCSFQNDIDSQYISVHQDKSDFACQIISNIINFRLSLSLRCKVSKNTLTIKDLMFHRQLYAFGNIIQNLLLYKINAFKKFLIWLCNERGTSIDQRKKL